MGKFRLKMLPVHLLALVSLMALGASASSPSAGESTPSSSPSADVGLICHTDNAAECYPKVFRATDEFQVVHDDQDLPLGLHVRLNVYTGKKEAKINVPDEHDPALEGLPVDSSVVIVDQGEDTANDQAKRQIPRDAPAYDTAGKIKKPNPASSDEGSAFYKSLTILKKGLDVDGALEMLEDISHDIYYGLKIAEDYDTVHELFCLAASSPSPSSQEGGKNDKSRLITTRARLAALTLASAVQNNPKALAEIETHWPKLSTSRCSSSPSPLGITTFTLSVANSNPGSGSHLGHDAAALTKARITLLSGLLKSPLFRTHFLSPLTNGPSHLLRILFAPSPSSPSPDVGADANAWSSAQRSAAFLLLDNFLDADMGAKLGEWPSAAKDKAQQLSDAECASIAEGAYGTGEGEREGKEEACMDSYLKRLTKKHAKEKEHWSHGLRAKLAEHQMKKVLKIAEEEGKVDL